MRIMVYWGLFWGPPFLETPISLTVRYQLGTWDLDPNRSPLDRAKLDGTLRDTLVFFVISDRRDYRF